MKFICEKDALLKEISVSQEIISTRTSISILSNVMLKAENSKLVIRATDLKVAFETSLPVDVAIPGSTTVFCDKLLGILRSMPNGEIEFEDKDGNLEIRPLFKKINFKLKSVSADKYPEIQVATEVDYFSVPQEAFIEMNNQTIFSVSDDETRYFMNGVFFEKQDDSIVMVATDGKRLSYYKYDITKIPDFKSVILPTKVLNLVRKFATGEGDIYISVSDKTVFFQFNNQLLSSQIIEGQFPNYQRVIPQEQKYRISVTKSDFIEAVKRVSLLVEHKSRRIYFVANNNQLIISAEESDVGAAKEELSCEYNGIDATIAMNASYLGDPLRVIDGDQVVMEFTETNKAVTLSSNPRKNYFHIIMPMQLD